MSTILAIKGHPTRGNEIITLLERMGGYADALIDNGTDEKYAYLIIKDENNAIDAFPIDKKDEFDFEARIFTLEEFLENYPYNLNELVLCNDGLVGVVDKMEWDCEKSDMKYHISSNAPRSYDIPIDNKWYSSKNIKCKFVATKGKKLAIKGHSTRGKEVIVLLEMMGGKNRYNLNGLFSENAYYCIGGPHNDEILGGEYMFGNENIYWFTLEEFLKKYPFKVGDSVFDKANGCPGVVSEMKWDEGLSDMKYHVVLGNGIVEWYANGSIDFFRNNGNLEENKFPSFEPTFKINGEIEYKIPDGYEITEVSKNKVFIKPIKSKYPTEYEECVRIAKNIHGYDIHVDVPAYGELMESFVKLLICRDAYWKIAGEQMGLDKPWDINCGGWGYWIGYDVNANKIYCQDSRILLNHLLVFPTEEMRDIFYRNFMDLIEQCKEIL